MGAQQRCVFVAVVLTLAVGSGHAVGICDVCQCARSQGEVKSVVCDCNSQNKVLNITVDKMVDVVHITEFGVSNCSSVNFYQSAFKLAHDLHSVMVSRVNTVTFNVGVFSSLSSLHVEDVSDLRLAKMAFLGATIQEISVFRSNLSVLHDLVLYDVVGLRKLEFDGVIIGQIKTAAVKVAMAENSEFVIKGSEVGMVERGAVDLQTSRLMISKSLFEGIRYQAVNVVATESIHVMKNFFSANCSSNGLVLVSNSITVEENTFSYLPIGLLRRALGATSSVSFTKNIVYNFTLMSEGVDLSTMLYLDDFQDNEVLCDCNLAKSVLAYEVFQAASGPRAILEQNRCHLESSSSCQLSLQQLSDEQLRACGGKEKPNLKELCQSLSTSTSTSRPTRGGRAEEPPASAEPWTTTPTTTAASGGQHAAPHHTVSTGATYSNNAVLTALAILTSAAKRLLA